METLRVIGLLAILTVGPALSQEVRFGSREYAESFAREYGIADLKTHYRAAGESEISTLKPLLEWLEKRFNARVTHQTKKADLIWDFSDTIAVAINEDELKKTFQTVSFSVSLAGTFEGSGTLAAYRLSQSSVRYSRGSFSGLPVGDWVAHYDDGSNPPSLMFFRKNVMVTMNYGGPYEMLKSDQSRRRLPDPSIRDKCEDLAREIDEQIQKLPTGPKKEAK